MIKARCNFKHIVFSYIIKANFFEGGFAFFCNFVRNKIYVLEIEVLISVNLGDVQNRWIKNMPKIYYIKTFPYVTHITQKILE